uniref:NADH-ubiquinone oxidoreductase chain 2 n=1 Tax=Cryptocellus narino TaxID=1329480 RepID=W5R4N7_9ARAC|nr:NADH dehydrogenase subunit 2 [Cryptocellus narino]AGL11932.1 NADH dehydrogenase subunit 2 [Cryptocellus narino]
MSNLIMSTMILSIIMIISSNSWFQTWISFEINMLTFIGWTLHEKHHEAMIKYFLVQAMGSSLFIASSLLISPSIDLPEGSHIIYVLPAMAILIKIGSAPFHLWYPEVMSMINWSQCMMLTTGQKLGPLFIVYQLNTNVTLFALASSIMGSVSSLNQTSLRKLMAFSSISHNGWMLMCISLQIHMWVWYFLIYSIINISIMNILNKMKLSFINQIKTKSTTSKLSLIISILALSGLPPTIGFMPKWSIICKITLISTMASFILIFSSLIIMFAYMNMIYNSLFNTHQDETMLKINNKLPLSWYFLTTLPLIPLILV